MRGFELIGIRNWLLLLTFVVSSTLIAIFWSNQGLEWTSFVLCAYIIGTVNILTLVINFKKYDFVIIGFLFFRCFWSFSFTIYMLFIEFDLIPSLGLAFIIFFSCLVILDVLIILFNRKLFHEVGSGFIPKSKFEIYIR